MSVLALLAPWDSSPTVVLVSLCAALWYLRRRTQVSAVRQWSFWTGLALGYAVLNTQFDYYAQHEFFMHRLQHLVLHHLGPFLMALGLPEQTVSMWQAGPRHKAWAVRLLRMVAHPFLTAALFNLLVLFWLIPAVHFPAMLDWRLYRVMNWSMFVNGLLFWVLVLRGAAPAFPPATTATRIVLMLAVIPAQIAIGALIFFAPVELYPIYTLCGRAFAGIDALQDQQIGGLILWVPGAMMSVAGILIVLQRRLTVTAPLESPQVQ
jgi:putative membrane protein